MELETAIRERRSCRAYRPDPVPDNLIRECVEAAIGCVEFLAQGDFQKAERRIAPFARKNSPAGAGKGGK